MLNVVTIAREYGSGGAEVGRAVADMLGWEYLDKEIIERASAAGHMARNRAEAADEKSQTWWGKVLLGFQQTGQGMIPPSTVDYDTVRNSTVRVIQEAAKVGNCVIIGRSAQCILRHQPKVLRMLVYGPLKEKLVRMKERHPGEKNLEALLRRKDSERLHYARYYYDCDSADPRLYHITINSTLGIDNCAGIMAGIIRGS